ncbi:MAG: CHAT domain-containing tetratricopeptide repeat protein [Pyrinomonadaceae bacterium]
MTQDIEQQVLRQYLLGAPLDAAQRQGLEERLLIDDDFCEEFEVAEDVLIEQYLCDELSVREREGFERNFLSTTERRQKLVLARSLNRYAATMTEPHSARSETRSGERGTASARADEDDDAKAPPRVSFWSRRPAIAYAGLAAALVILVAGGLLWRSSSRRQDVERGLLALNEAYRQQRPGEARITGLAYAPAAATRGGASDRFDYAARDRAERILQDTAHEQGGAAALHALGRLYLSERQYDKAIEQFEAALKSAPVDARLHSDLGAALMERGNNEPSSAPDGASLTDFASSLEHLNRALEIDALLPDALFNRALLYQSMKLPRQAAEDWRRYLEVDTDSPWAAEARRNLKLLEEQHSISEATPQTLQEFLGAYRARDDERAWQIMSGSREMITGRMVPFQLARSALEADTEGRRVEADELLAALEYAGRLERARADDPFVADLASYYVAVGSDSRRQLAAAHAELGAGYRLCQVSQHDEAHAHFAHARSLFSAAGDTAEARLTDYWLAYCIGQGDRLEEGAALLDDLAAFCRQRNYRWLLSQALCWLANCYDLLGDHSRSLTLDRQALDIAVAIEDSYNQQKLLTQLALQYTELGRPENALDYHQRTLSLSASTPPSPRQDWRNLTYAAQTFYALKRYQAAAAYEREALRLSLDESRDPALAHLSYTHLGMILAGTGQYDEALRQTAAGLEVARALQNDSVSRKMMAYSLLQLGHLARQAGDCRAALERYDEALRLYDGMEIAKLDGYDAHKGRLLCYLNGNDDAAIEGELARVLALFEQDRTEIVEEQNRNSFFDAEQDIYDIAIGYAYARGDNPRAFAYSEQSRGRSLLDLLTHGTKISAAGMEPEVAVEAAASPLDLAAVQSQLPPGTQVVQYAVLKDRLLIWVVSRTRFEVRERLVPATELNARIMDYVALLTRNDESQAGEVRRRAEALYDLLVAPVAPLLGDTFEVYVVPDKALFHLPFAALVAPATGRYLIQDFTLLFAPSASVLVHCSHTARQRAQVAHDETLLSVGNPAFDRAAYPQLPDLPAAEVEAKKVAQIYGGAPALTGTGARKATFMELLPRANVIHFAGHYVADESAPLRSRLLFAKDAAGDDALTAAEVFGKQLPQARLVILSACQTELERYDNGEGMIGIARTFLAAGAPLVVASQWPVDSYATAELMVSFHRLRKLEGLSTAAALRRAQQEMLAGSDERHRAPFYWAAFLPVGGHADY